LLRGYVAEFPVSSSVVALDDGRWRLPLRFPRASTATISRWKLLGIRREARPPRARRPQ
jgi:hypothetical protein